MESRASLRKLAIEAISRASAMRTAWDPTDILGARAAGASEDLLEISLDDVCLREVTLFAGGWAGDGEGWVAYDLGIGTWWIEHGLSATGVHDIVHVVPVAGGSDALREARDWCIGQCEALSVGLLPEEITLYRGEEPRALRALCEVFLPDSVEASLMHLVAHPGESIDDFELGVTVRFLSGVRLRRREPTRVPGSCDRTVRSAPFSDWVATEELRWPDTGVALTCDTAERLRLVAMFLEAVGGARVCRIKRHR